MSYLSYSSSSILCARRPWHGGNQQSEGLKEYLNSFPRIRAGALDG